MATRPWGVLDLFAPVPNSQMDVLVQNPVTSPKPDTQKRPRSEVQITRTLADGRPVFTFESKCEAGGPTYIILDSLLLDVLRIATFLLFKMI